MIELAKMSYPVKVGTVIPLHAHPGARRIEIAADVPIMVERDHKSADLPRPGVHLGYFVKPGDRLRLTAFDVGVVNVEMEFGPFIDPQTLVLDSRIPAWSAAAEIEQIVELFSTHHIKAGVMRGDAAVVLKPISANKVTRFALMPGDRVCARHVYHGHKLSDVTATVRSLGDSHDNH